MAVDLKVGDWVRLTGRDWKDYEEGVTVGSVIEVTEVEEDGPVYAGDAGVLYFGDTANHQISGYEWELAGLVPTLGDQLGIEKETATAFDEAVAKFSEAANVVVPVETAIRSVLDAVNPDHYKFGKAEVIEITRHLGFLEGNVVKYVTRAARKGNRLEDLKKARKYLDWAIEDAEDDQ